MRAHPLLLWLAEARRAAVAPPMHASAYFICTQKLSLQWNHPKITARKGRSHSDDAKSGRGKLWIKQSSKLSSTIIEVTRVFKQVETLGHKGDFQFHTLICCPGPKRNFAKVRHCLTSGKLFDILFQLSAIYIISDTNECFGHFKMILFLMMKNIIAQ